MRQWLLRRVAQPAAPREFFVSQYGHDRWDDVVAEKVDSFLTGLIAGVVLLGAILLIVLAVTA